MFSKIYVSVKRFIKDFWKEILFILCFYLIMNYPVNYYIFTSGGITDLNNRFTVVDSYKQDGSYSLSYVNELEGNVLTYLLSFVMPNWERAKMSDYQLDNSESAQELYNRSQISLKKANQTAIKLAYDKANKEFKIKDQELYVMYRQDYSDDSSDIKVGDRILKVNDKKLTSLDVLAKEIEKTKLGDYVSLELKRNEKIITTKIKVREEKNKKIVGLIMTTIYDYETSPSISFSFKSDESGGSAGLMMTLAIYDSLISEDLTKGRKIAGTGTIAEDGSVGEIGGVKYKLVGANKDDADVFLVPYGENYDECLKVKEEKNLNIKIIAVKTFDDAIEKLKSS